MQDTFTRRVIIRIGIAAAMIAVFVVFIIILNIDINKHTENITAAKLQIAQRVNAISQLSDLKREAAQAQEYSGTLSAILPSRDQLVGLPRGLQKLAGVYKVDLGFAFGSETAAKDTDPGSIRFTMTLTGSLSGVIGFLKEIESSPYFISLATEDLTVKERGIYTFSTSGEIYTK